MEQPARKLSGSLSQRATDMGVAGESRFSHRQHIRSDTWALDIDPNPEQLGPSAWIPPGDSTRQQEQYLHGIQIWLSCQHRKHVDQSWRAGKHLFKADGIATDHPQTAMQGTGQEKKAGEEKKAIIRDPVDAILEFMRRSDGGVVVSRRVLGHGNRQTLTGGCVAGECWKELARPGLQRRQDLRSASPSARRRLRAALQTRQHKPPSFHQRVYCAYLSSYIC